MLLGLNPFSLAVDDFRPDHVPGHILSNVVIGTVRLRQQRVRLQCQDKNALQLQQSEILCYHPDLIDTKRHQTGLGPASLPQQVLPELRMALTAKQHPYAAVETAARVVAGIL